MSETVGRVDFIADLDGRGLPAKARELGEKIGREGGKSFSEKFGNEVDSTFDRRMSDTANRVADTLSKKGKLAGSKFSKDFDAAVRSNFRSMQREVADILSNRDSFEKFARGFDTVEEAVDRLKLNLERLRIEGVRFRDENNKLIPGAVLTNGEFTKFAETADRLGQELQVVRDKESQLVLEHERMREAVRGLEEDHRLLNHRIGDLGAFRAYAAQLGTTGRAHRALGAQIEDLGKKLGLSRVDMDIAREKLDETTVTVARQNRAVWSLSSRWNDLSHNTRQWTLIIGAVAAGLRDMAVLGSAAGAGIFALGGGITALVGGGGALAAVFSVLGKDLDKLPPSMRDVVGQAKGLGQEFLTTRNIIADSAFRQMPDTFDKLSGTLHSLNPDLSRLGTVTGRVFDDFADGLGKGSAGLKELRGLVNNASDDFPALADAAGTWTLALIRGINRANPLVDQMIGYIDKLGKRFDTFTRSSSFDDWIQRSSVTFTKFGDLLDATGRALNDLVTPESARRTQDFLDNLTAFMPNLGRMLDVISRLDVFGLAAQALNDFGQALEPLSEPAARLADALNDTAQVIIGTLADALGVVAHIAEPLATTLADLLNAMPPEALAALAFGITGVTLAMKGLAVASAVAAGTEGLSGASLAVGGFLNTLGGTKVGGAVGGFVGKLAPILGKAGVWGAIAGGTILAGAALINWAKSLDNTSGKVDQFISGAKNIRETTGLVADGFWVGGQKVRNWNVVFSAMAGTLDVAKVKMKDVGDASGSMGNKFGLIQGQVDSFKATLDTLDPKLADLAGKNLPMAQEAFARLADQTGANDTEIMTILGTMDEYKAKLMDVATTQGLHADKSTLVALATGDLTREYKTQDQVLGALRDSSGLTGEEIDSLSAKMQAFADKNLSARSSARDYEAALDDLTASIAENGTGLDINTEQGRNNEAALDRIASATRKLAEDTLKQTGNQADANTKILEGRDALIQQLGKFGIVGQAAEDYADKLGLIKPDVSTDVILNGAQVAEDTLNRITRNRVAQITAYVKNAGLDDHGRIPMATGGTVFGPTRALIGEAGPEAIVPLNRPLSQVDPSVRLLSAIAQGKMPALAGGGIAGAQSKTVIFEAGAIVVQGAQDPRRAAIEVANEVADRVGS